MVVDAREVLADAGRAGRRGAHRAVPRRRAAGAGAPPADDDRGARRRGDDRAGRPVVDASRWAATSGCWTPRCKVRGELPYACKGGVCSTCRAKVVDGEVTMARNYALEPDEVAAGYVLTCQSSPTTDRLVVDYDA